MEYPEVTIGAPVRNRAWILGDYLAHLVTLDYPRDKIRFVFILNDSTDNSEVILSDFKKVHEKEYKEIKIIKMDQGAIQDARITEVREKIYTTLSQIRNVLIGQIETPYLFSIDTDILVPPHALKTLVESDKDIVAGVVWNDFVERPVAVYPNVRTNLLIEDENGLIDHYMKYPLKSLFRVHSTGAMYLLKKEVCQQVLYCYDPQGEDIGFCKMAKEKGIEVWANSNVYGSHVMIVYQAICKDCVSRCKAHLIRDNVVSSKLAACPRRIKKSSEQMKMEIIKQMIHMPQHG
jgi:hypothetical protein